MKKRKLGRFLDVEAEVDDEEDEAEEPGDFVEAEEAVAYHTSPEKSLRTRLRKQNAQARIRAQDHRAKHGARSLTRSRC